MKKNVFYKFGTVLVLLLSACGTVTRLDSFKQCKVSVDSINSMKLYEAYLVPVDRQGKYVYEEFLLPEMYDHCELVSSNAMTQASVIMQIYFDAEGRVRKCMNRWADGGSLNSIAYYGEDGALIYSAFANGCKDYGRVFAHGGRMRVEHTYSKDWLRNDFLTAVYMSTDELAHHFDIELKMPDNCRGITFSPIQCGEWAFISAGNVYGSPHRKDVRQFDESLEIGFGREVRIDSIARRWCRIKVPAMDSLTLYVPIDSVEVSQVNEGKISL